MGSTAGGSGSMVMSPAKGSLVTAFPFVLVVLPLFFSLEVYCSCFVLAPFDLLFLTLFLFNAPFTAIELELSGRLFDCIFLSVGNFKGFLHSKKS